MKEITDLQLAWCAGVVDVLGLISVRKMKTGSELASVAISSTRIDLLKEIAELTGSSVVMVHRDYNRLNCNIHCPEKHSHVVSSTGRWSLTGARAAVFLNAIEPYLRLKQGTVREVVDAGANAPHKAATLRKMYNLGWPKLEVVSLKFSETMKLADPGLVVSRLHDAWVVRNDAHPIYSAEAMAFALKALTKRDRVRKGTLSASSLGECEREQQFTFLGMPKLPPDEKNAAKMQNGSFMHLRWQMEGLSQGWLHEAEVALAGNGFRLSGTMDGILYENSILELKSINANGFSRVQAFGPLTPHLFQMATYMLCTGRTKGVFIYECKDNQEYKEIVVTRDEVPLLEAELKARHLWALIGKKELVEPLSDCIDRKGWKYHSCPFRDRCLGIREWEEVG